VEISPASYGSCPAGQQPEVAKKKRENLRNMGSTLEAGPQQEADKAEPKK
jgi:hypothetical protein